MKFGNNFAKFNIFPATAGAKGGEGEGCSQLRRATTLRWVIYPLQGLGGIGSRYVGASPYAGVFDPVGVGQCPALGLWTLATKGTQERAIYHSTGACPCAMRYIYK